MLTFFYGKFLSVLGVHYERSMGYQVLVMLIVTGKCRKMKSRIICKDHVTSDIRNCFLEDSAFRCLTSWLSFVAMPSLLAFPPHGDGNTAVAAVVDAIDCALGVYWSEAQLCQFLPACDIHGA